jgi:hypothetical protein
VHRKYGCKGSLTSPFYALALSAKGAADTAMHFEMALLSCLLVVFIHFFGPCLAKGFLSRATAKAINVLGELEGRSGRQEMEEGACGQKGLHGETG